MQVTLSESAIVWLNARAEEREARIAEIVSAKGCERILAAIMYDSEFAPKRTQGDILDTLGIVGKGITPASATDAEVDDRLARIVCGLALLHTYLSGTDHLTNRHLLNRLETSVLTEEINFIPPTPDMSEYVDLSTCPPCMIGETCAVKRGSDDAWPKVTERDETLPRPKRGEFERVDVAEAVQAALDE